MKIIGKFALGALLAVALACNANAKEEGKQQKEEKVKWIAALPDGKKEDKRPYSVPDAASTAALLGYLLPLSHWRGARLPRVE